MDRIAEIRTKKQTTYQTLRELFADLEAGDWDRPVHAHEEGWTVRELLAHLATAGAGLFKAAQLMAEGRLDMRPDFDLDFWNRRQVDKRADRSNAQLLEDLEALNREVLAYLDGLAADDDHDDRAVLDRRGEHAVFGDVTVEFMLRRVYRHEREHAEELRRTLRNS